MSSTPTAAEPGGVSAGEAISIVQRGNLKSLEATLRKQWRLGQNIVLCWSSNEKGIMALLVPHYFLGNYSASDGDSDERDNEAFIRQLISGRRRKDREEFFEIASRFNVSATFIKLSEPLEEDPRLIDSVEQIIKRYGLSYVENRAVLLFDIAEFSLYTPFEQASQLNSLSYSMNSAYNKLLGQGIDINFARTTTGDGYYVWNRDISDGADRDLLYFLLLVIADNAIAREASKGNTVPVIRMAYHIGSHYELYQAEGVNPTVFSYIVGDVTIELARMLDLAQPGQLYVGDFQVPLPDEAAGGLVDTPAYLAYCSEQLQKLYGIQLAGEAISSMSCDPARTGGVPRRFRLTDKHGISRAAYSLQIDIALESGREFTLGLTDEELPAPLDNPEGGESESIDGRSVIDINQRAAKSVVEE